MYLLYVASIIAVEESTAAATSRTGIPFSKQLVMKVCLRLYAVASFGRSAAAAALANGR